MNDCDLDLLSPTSTFRLLCSRQQRTTTLQVPSVKGRLMILDSEEEAKEIVLSSARDSRTTRRPQSRREKLRKEEETGPLAICVG